MDDTGYFYKGIATMKKNEYMPEYPANATSNSAVMMLSNN